MHGASCVMMSSESFHGKNDQFFSLQGRKSKSSSLAARQEKQVLKPVMFKQWQKKGGCIYQPQHISKRTCGMHHSLCTLLT